MRYNTLKKFMDELDEVNRVMNNINTPAMNSYFEYLSDTIKVVMLAALIDHRDYLESRLEEIGIIFKEKHND